MSNTETMLENIGEVRHHPNWFIALGIVFILGGVFAIALPEIASVAASFAVAWALILVGAWQIVHSWAVRSWGGFMLQAVIGLIIMVGGIAILFDPIGATVSLTLLLGVVFIAKGVMQVILGMRYRPHANWGWMVAAGAVAVVLGILIVVQWPLSGMWVLGTLAGVSLIFSGWSYIMVALAARAIDKA